MQEEILNLPIDGLRLLKLLMKRAVGFVWILVYISTSGLSGPIPVIAEEGQNQSPQMLFGRYCRDCHGLQRDGKGDLGPFLENSPADLTSQATQLKTDQELFSIIKDGGGVEMHGWADRFSDEQILGWSGISGRFASR